MKDIPSRRKQLISAALTGDLSDDEWQEFEQAWAPDPTIDSELAELRATAARLDAGDITWREETVPHPSKSAYALKSRKLPFPVDMRTAPRFQYNDCTAAISAGSFSVIPKMLNTTGLPG